MAYEPLTGEYSLGVHVVYTKTCKAGEYSPARPLGSSKTWLGSTPWPTTCIYYATNSMAGNSLATMPIFGWGAWVWVVCWVGSVGAAGGWPVCFVGGAAGGGNLLLRAVGGSPSQWRAAAAASGGARRQGK